MSSSTIKTAVVTGGHSYDVVGFHRLFRELVGVEAYIQHMDDFASSPAKTRDSYDAVVFYNMHMEGPLDEGRPWFTGKPEAALAHLGEAEQGILMFHHAILAYPDWSTWNEIVGMEDRALGAYHHDQSLHIDIANDDHPITSGLSAWDMIDETYTMADAGEGNDILLTTQHPNSARTIGWTRQFRNARVLCFQSGHDNQTWPNATFREVLRRGIGWITHRI